MSEIEGILLVDKAKGSSSFKVVSKVRRALGTRAVGHVGTLDPLASGLLVFLIGRYTRLSNYLMAGSKKYRAVIELGTSTNTDDKEGEVVDSCAIEHVSIAHILACLPGFEGMQQQVPPVFSAISVDGVRSYRRARAGEAIEMAPREIEIMGLEFISYEAPLLSIDVSCSKGTYIRSLARDIGVKLGTVAHLADLRRLECSAYRVSEALLESDLEDSAKVISHLQRGKEAIRGMDFLDISSGQAQRLRNGLRVDWNLQEANDNILVATHQHELVALCRLDNSQLISVRGF